MPGRPASVSIYGAAFIAEASMGDAAPTAACIQPGVSSDGLTAFSPAAPDVTGRTAPLFSLVRRTCSATSGMVRSGGANDPIGEGVGSAAVAACSALTASSQSVLPVV